MTPSPIVPRPYQLPTPTVLPPLPNFIHHGAGIGLSSSIHGSPSSTDPRDPLHFCFCIPFRIIPGPDAEDVVFATDGAMERWIPNGSAPIAGTHKLPVHQKNLDYLRRLCREISETEACKASVTVGDPRTIKRKKRGAVMNVSLAGDPDTVYRMRGMILQSLPVSLKTASIDVDTELVYGDGDKVTEGVDRHLNDIARFTGTDIFLIRLPARSPQSLNDASQYERLKVQIFGDSESVECAKTKMLLMIDEILKQVVHVTSISISLVPLICGRARKNVQHIEATTRTCIYFPNMFPGVYGYRPKGAAPRQHDTIYITGNTQEGVFKAERMLVELMMNLQIFTKSATIAMLKADYIILERLDDVKRIMEANGTFVQFPALGTVKGVLRVQGAEAMFVEKTIKQIMQISGQYYNASWWLLETPSSADKLLRPPTDRDIHEMLTDISVYSGSEISYSSRGFEIHGSDDAVKMALEIVNEIRFVKQYAYQIRVRIELANEHKEFVAGKKNGKINKIMGQSNVQVMFEGFNEYNFYICVVSSKYEPAMFGLELVEQELPAAVSFYVPDQYHKRIIGIQGAHIQRLMKKYSVYVKFLNPTEREVGSGGWLDADLTGDNNVVIRTPARNAANLELVKGEIMDTVQKVDAEVVVETVVVPRLFHRSLIANIAKLQDLEKKWGCTIIFPSSEEASDTVSIKGPEWQLPDAVNEFLSHVPEQHKMRMAWTPSLEELLSSETFKEDVAETMRDKFGIDVTFCPEPHRESQAVSLAYTRNNTGNLQDAIDYLTTLLAKHGVNSEPIKGGIARPKSDTFEEAFPFFNSKLLQSAPLPMGTDEAKRLSGEVTASMQSDLAKMINASSEAAFNSVKPPGSSGSTASSSSRRSTIGNGVGVVGQETMQKRLSISSTGSGPHPSNIWSSTNNDADTDWPVGNGLVGGLERLRRT